MAIGRRRGLNRSDQKKSFQYWYRSLPMMPRRTTDLTAAFV